MAYTRVYPIGVKSYDPSKNPSIKGRCTVTSGSSDINVGEPAYSAAAVGWVVTIYSTVGNDVSVIGSYAISAKVGAPTSFTLTETDGTAWAAPAGSTGQYNYIVFNPDVPTSNDYSPEAILFSKAPTSDMSVILKSGQYTTLNKDLFVKNAIYSISILEIIGDGGAEGLLLGNDGANGTSFITR